MKREKLTHLQYILIGVILSLCGMPRGVAALDSPHREAAGALVPSMYAHVPLSFEVNRGQAEAPVRFLSRVGGYTLFLTAREAVLLLGAKPGTSPQTVTIRLMNSDPSSRVDGVDELPGKANYLLGDGPRQWRTNVPTYATVRYRNVYPGVDQLVSAKSGKLKYDFVLAAGVRPDCIRLRFQGMNKLTVDSQGNLVALLAGAQIQLMAPFAYQEHGLVRKKVAAKYVLAGRREVTFRLGDFDKRFAVVIDPVLSYSTYLGGGSNSNASGSAIAVDAGGNAYVAGSINDSFNFPITRGAFQSSLQPSGSAGGFVTKFNPSGNVLLYSTYFSAAPTAIAVDTGGNVVMTGSSHGVQIPTTTGAYQTSCKPNLGSGSCEDAFVTKLNAAGSGLVYSTHLGGSGSDVGRSIAVDSAGSVYVTGMTSSKDFPTTKGALQSTINGSSDAFLSKLSTDGSSLVYSTYFGGPGYDFGQGIAVDAGGNAYVSGTADSGFPTTPGVLNLSCPDLVNENGSIFVAKVSPTGSALIYSATSNCSNGGARLAVDASGKAFLAGTTHSRQLPTTVGAFQSDNLRGTFRAFILKLNSTATGLSYSTYLGGTVSDGATAIAVDSAGRALVTGVTVSSDFPVTSDAFQSALSGISAFFTAVSPDGTAVAFSTYLGGTQGPGANGTPSSQGNAVAVDGAGNAYITGQTNSQNFETTNPFQSTLLGTTNAFVTKVVLNRPTINPGGAVVAASFTNLPLSAASIVSLFGTGFASGAATAGTIPLPTSLAGVTVQVNNQQAPLFFVSPNQINFQMPWELMGASQGLITVTVNGVVGGQFAVPMASFGPGLFSTNSTGSGQGAITIAATGEIAAPTGSLGSVPARPANRGEFVSIYCTGLGAVTNAPATGVAAPSGALANALTNPLVNIGGISAMVNFAGLAPSFVSLYQVNAQVPANAQTGSAIPVVLSIGGVLSNTVTIAVQ